MSVLAVAVLGSVDWPARDYRDGDHFQFWAGSRALLARESPYDLQWWVAFHISEGSRAIHAPPQPPESPAWTTPYPLWTFIVLMPLALLPYVYAAAAWLVVQMLVLAGSLAALARALYGRPRADGLLLFGIVAGSQPAWLLVTNGNVTGFLFGALAGGFTALLSRRPYIAGLLFGLLAIKPHTFLLVPFAVLVTVGDRRRLIAGSLTTAFALLMSSLLIHPGWIGEWVVQAGSLQSSAGSNATLLTLDRVIHTPLTVPVAVLAAVGSFGGWWYLSRPTPQVVFAGAVAVSVLVAPHGWSYDHLHLAVVVAVIIWRLRQAPAIRTIAVTALAAVFGPLSWLLYLAAFARNGEELSVIVPIAIFALLVLVEAYASRRAPGPTSPL